MKNELKYYDQAFANRFQRIPNRNEKEPMRQIYMYYKKLKQYITKAQANKQRPAGGSTANSSLGENNNTM